MANVGKYCCKERQLKREWDIFLLRHQSGQILGKGVGGEVVVIWNPPCYPEILSGYSIQAKVLSRLPSLSHDFEFQRQSICDRLTISLTAAIYSAELLHWPMFSIFSVSWSVSCITPCTGKDSYWRAPKRVWKMLQIAFPGRVTYPSALLAGVESPHCMTLVDSAPNNLEGGPGLPMPLPAMPYIEP